MVALEFLVKERLGGLEHFGTSDTFWDLSGALKNTYGSICSRQALDIP